MKHLLHKIREAWTIKKINTQDDLKDFLYAYSAKNAGQVIVKYAQKRLGKIHYNLTKDDDTYNKELIRCQISIHAEILSDIGHLVARLCKISTVSQSKVLEDCLKEAHRIYVLSSPSWYEGDSLLDNQHLNRADKALKELSIQTGVFLFELLPMTDDLRKSNITIFQSQIRFIYIHFLEQLGRRISVENLQKIVVK